MSQNKTKLNTELPFLFQELEKTSSKQPILIAGPTASGKSKLALQISERFGGMIVNADALQVFSNWQILTARPDKKDLARANHALYGHVPGDKSYSVGQWLCDVQPLLSGIERVIIVGGTGLYFSALTQGLAEIPETEVSTRIKAQARLEKIGISEMVRELSEDIAKRIDCSNPMRVLRAWEVYHQTGRSLAKWQDDTPAPILPLSQAKKFLLFPEKALLNQRIKDRFETMIKNGLLDEIRANLLNWDPRAQSARAIGAKELIAFLRNEIDYTSAIEKAINTTCQYAKRQRTWFRGRMTDWQKIES